MSFHCCSRRVWPRNHEESPIRYPLLLLLLLLPQRYSEARGICSGLRIGLCLLDTPSWTILRTATQASFRKPRIMKPARRTRRTLVYGEDYV